MEQYQSRWVAVLGLSLALVAGAADLSAPVTVEDSATLRTQLGLGRFESRPPAGLSSLKIAILDRGFADLRKEDLPESARLETFENATPTGAALDRTAHGAAMARILWAVTGSRAEGPQFYLLNANGLTNFRHAVDFVIREKISLVVHAHNWEFGGNFDGKGFINAEVSRATQAGVLWIAAAGNYGGKVRSQRLAPGFRSTDCLPFENRLDRNSVTATLAWNDFADTEEYATRKDLALVLTRSQDTTPLAVADRKQAGEIPKLNEQTQKSAHAREILEQELPRGRYCLRVEARSTEWTAQDRFRLTLTATRADAVSWTDLSPAQARGMQQNEIMVPADHPEVITVGDRSQYSARAAMGKGQLKPEVLIASSELRLSDGSFSAGTSNAAALVGGWAAVQLAAHPEVLQGNSRAQFLELLARQRPDWVVPMPQAGSQDLSSIPPAQLAPLLSGIVEFCGIRPEQIMSANRIQDRTTVWISQGEGPRPRCLPELQAGATLGPRTFVRVVADSAQGMRFEARQALSLGRVSFEDERWGQAAYSEIVLVP